MSGPGRLLIVDDEPEVRAVLKESLLDHVGMIFEAESGLDALEKLKTLKVHAIISDLSMPKLTGIELLRKLRERGEKTPFIILTGFGDKALAVEALRLGAFDLLDKPWQETQIIDVVERAVAAGISMEAPQA